MEKSINSVLSMEKLVFDEISFRRNNLKNDKSQFDFELQISVGISPSNDLYKVTLKMIGEKENEYDLTISLSGFFSFDSDDLDDNLKKDLIEKNSVAIMMPYLRSQISLITAQPDVECVVLPPFNITNMMSNK